MNGVKNRNRIWWKILIAAALAAAVLAYLWVFVLEGRSLFPETSATVDGQISYAYSEQVQAALRSTESGCGQAEIIRSDPNQGEKTVAIAYFGLSSESVNDQLLRLLEEYGYQATFFVSGVEAAENEDFLQALREQGHDLGSGGLKGEGRAETKTQAQLVEDLVRSSQVLASLTDQPANLLYCPNTVYTDQVLQAALASGYEKVVEPDSAYILDYDSFETEAEARAFAENLAPGTLLMIVTDGSYQEIPLEPEVQPDVPAIDKQAGLQSQEEEPEERAENAVELTGWLLRSFQELAVQAVPVDRLASEPGAVETAERKALIYNSFLTDQQEVGLSLWGLSDPDTLERVRELLEEYGAQATFFATEPEVNTLREELTELAQAGYSVANGGSGSKDRLSQEALYQDILACGKALESVTQEKLMAFLPVGQLPLGEIYEEEALRLAAGAAGYVVLSPSNPETPCAGALYGIDLSEEDALEKLEEMLSEADAAGLAIRDVGRLLEDSGQMPAMTASEMRALRAENDGALAEIVSGVSTTEAAMSFLFYGVRNQAVTADVTRCLAAHGAAGTFFATLSELQNSQTQIETLLAAGQEVAVAYVENSTYPAEFDAVVRYLNSCRNYMRWRYGVEPELVLLPFDSASSEVREAASAAGFRIVDRGYTVVRSEDREIGAAGAAAAVEEVFTTTSLTRGGLVYFNMSYYQQDLDLEAGYRGETVCGNVVEAVLTQCVDAIAYRNPDTGEIEDGSRYAVKTCRDLLDSPLCYTLPDNQTQTDVALDKNVLTDMESDEERFAYIAEHYVGTPSADTYLELPGFDNSEVQQLDKDGLITDEKVLFITFDDWGTDQAINKLLYVLEKHDVKATFFIRANYVSYNPNLLRAIAEAGHEIASHSFNHLALADYNTSTRQYLNLSEEEIVALRNDLVQSYNELYRYVGDIEVNGEPALSPIFRPPTLAVSKDGISQVFDVGFTYSVSGNFSTHDYEANSVEELIHKFETGIRSGDQTYRIENGSCIVMHMSDESIYTAQALDIMIPIWKEQGYQFARVDSYLS